MLIKKLLAGAALLAGFLPGWAAAGVPAGENIGWWHTTGEWKSHAKQVKDSGKTYWRVTFNWTDKATVLQRLKDAKSYADANGLKLIVVWQSSKTTGNSSLTDLDWVVGKWLEQKDWFTKNTSVILNIANEWGEQASRVAHWSWFQGYEAAVKRLRTNGITNPIMIDADGWGQNPVSIEWYGDDLMGKSWKVGTTTYRPGNIIYSVHVYSIWRDDSRPKPPEQGDYKIKETIQRLRTATGRPIFVGEWGSTHSLYYDESTVTSLFSQAGAMGNCRWEDDNG